MRGYNEKIWERSQLAPEGHKLRNAGKRIVSTNGCFDILHYGHIQYLQEARALGDVLVCGVNADVSVRGLKGSSRPIFPEKTRLAQLAALECVDFVFCFEEPTPEKFLAELQPHIHVKGGDYRPEELPEKKVVESFGGQVKILSLVEGYSTTAILNRLQE